MRAILDALRLHYGARTGADPAGREPFAALVGALLGPLPDRRAEAVLDALADDALLEPRRLAEADPEELVRAVAGHGVRFSPREALTLQRLARVLVNLSIDGLDTIPTERLREALGSIRGLGLAAADRLLLDGLDRPVYPVDRGSYRVAVRHGWIDPDAGLEEARSAFERVGDGDARVLHALSRDLRAVADEFCRPARPRCDRCPLRPFLPEGGPVEPDPT